jgi:hypothetical protein
MGYRGSVGKSTRRTCDGLEDEMAYVIVNDFGGGTREQYDATTARSEPGPTFGTSSKSWTSLVGPN